MAIVKLDDLNEKRNDSTVQGEFKRSRHKHLSTSVINQDYHELPKKSVRANGNIYHIVKPNNFRDVQNIYQVKSSMDMTLHKIKHFTSLCWDKKKSTTHN